MPHITIHGCDMDKCIQHITIHADVQFKPEYFRSSKSHIKMKELQSKLEQVLSEYFDELESDILSNHEWNTRI